MEVKKPTIKSIPYEDFKDNEYLENMVKQLNEGGTKVLVGCLDDLINWGRSNSLWPLTFATSCCGIEFKQSGFFFILYDSDRFSSWISEVVSLSAFTSVQSLVAVSFFLFLLKSPST